LWQDKGVDFRIENPERGKTLKRLKPFTYLEPATLQEAVALAAERDAGTYFLAGGTDLFVRMKRGEILPSALVNLKRIGGFRQIEKSPHGGLRIGSLVRISEIERSTLVLATHPVLAQAAGGLGSPSIRNLATVGGNIGRASPASDIAPSLMVLQARVAIEGPQGKREIDIGQLFLGPGKTVLSPAEVITSFFIPETGPHTRTAYLRLGRREGMDCALVGAAASLTVSDKTGEATEARIALASVGPIPLRAKRAEEVLLSGSLTEERLRESARRAGEESFPITDIRATGSYRKEMIRVLVYRALLKTVQSVRGEKEK
jgi:aerobic carbon-monoxide dehydrogenase medium subunit